MCGQKLNARNLFLYNGSKLRRYREIDFRIIYKLRIIQIINYGVCNSRFVNIDNILYC